MSVGRWGGGGGVGGGLGEIEGVCVGGGGGGGRVEGVGGLEERFPYQ